MGETIEKKIKKAKSILAGNWTGAYTMPARRLYPHQWNWDSGFVAIGYSHYNTDHAVLELKSLFSGQWHNGMLPQIVFNEERLGQYFPEPDFWQTEGTKNAPAGVLTSGITMPPIHALAVLKVFENARRPAEVKPFLQWIYPKLLAFHRYLYRERDPEGTGLVYIRHPWESGMDNSPMWDMVLKKIDLKKAELPPYERRDLGSETPETRPGDEHYDRFVYLVDLFRRLGYDEKAIRKECPFLIYGPLFNSVLAASNEALIKLSHILKRPSQEPQEWFDATNTAIRKTLYHGEHGMFDFYDLTEKRLLDVDTAAGFLPLFSGSATIEQASRLYDYLNSKSFCALHQGSCFSIPNYDREKEGFERRNYWRGPIWININWMIMQGLRRYGFVQKSDSVAKDILELPVRFGFYEYYDSFDGRGYGSENFSWTAALFIDTAYETFKKTGERPLLARITGRLRGDYVLNDGIEAADVAGEKLPQLMLSTIKDIKSEYYTDRGIVDYDAIKKSIEFKEYKKIAAGLRDFDLKALQGEREKLAFWIDLYNTIVVDGIIALDIKSSVKEVLGFFTRVKYIIAGHGFSPDDIEHGILRANARPPMHAFRQFNPFDARKAFALDSVDPRIHFALVCGSRSCAPIKFYTPENIDDELETATINFVNSSEVIVVPEEKKIIISMIFKWYERDFGGRDGVIDFIGKYIVDEGKRGFVAREKGNIKIEYLYYDWNLNK
ncbi:MAG: hypothetical protein BMS9Abin23_0517 [Thermodesulfobacteriota bacterium]|nr:MAG: hypothetical protein BMS9Abin23_0517 [Thermodesulfobacteriota bacterium]